MTLYIRWISLLLFLGVLILASTHINMQLRERKAAFVEPPPDRFLKWDPELFRALTFGHPQMAVDFLWIRALQDDNLTWVTENERAAVYYDLDLASSVDAASFNIYFYGAILLSVVRRDGPSARDLLLKAERFRAQELDRMPQAFQEKYWMDPYRIPMLLAYVYLFDLNDIPKAAQYYKVASTIPGAPMYLQRLVDKLSTRRGQYEVAIAHLNWNLKSIKLPSAREELEKKIQDLGISYFLFDIDEKFSVFLSKEPKGHYASKVERRKKLWPRFVRSYRVPARDPLGGEISISNRGEIVTTTEHRDIFSLKKRGDFK